MIVLLFVGIVHYSWRALFARTFRPLFNARHAGHPSHHVLLVFSIHQPAPHFFAAAFANSANASRRLNFASWITPTPHT